MANKHTVHFFGKKVSKKWQCDNYAPYTEMSKLLIN